jgi:hypothetical protein
MNLTKWLPAVKKETTALTKFTPPPATIDKVFVVNPNAPARRPPQTPERKPVFEVEPPIRDQIEVPRMCASRRMPWIARYIRVNYRWRFSVGVQVDRLTQYELFDTRVHDSIQLSCSDFEYERCAWCGAVGMPLHCDTCDDIICSGTLYRNGPETWCRCSCGQDSALYRGDYTQTAIYPKVRAR